MAVTVATACSLAVALPAVVRLPGRLSAQFSTHTAAAAAAGPTTAFEDGSSAAATPGPFNKSTPHSARGFGSYGWEQPSWAAAMQQEAKAAQQNVGGLVNSAKEAASAASAASAAAAESAKQQASKASAASAAAAESAKEQAGKVAQKVGLFVPFPPGEFRDATPTRAQDSTRVQEGC